MYLFQNIITIFNSFLTYFSSRSVPVYNNFNDIENHTDCEYIILNDNKYII